MEYSPKKSMVIHMENVKKNLSLQTIFQILNTFIPLITSPYLSRVLAAEKLGIFSYTQSVVNYFTLFAMLGGINYGTRAIAACKGDIKQRSATFWSIYLLQFTISLLALTSYLLYTYFYVKENLLIAMIQGLYILVSLTDVTWLYFGIENFETTVKINITVRVISVLSILLLVKSPEDLWIYTAIMPGSFLVSNIFLWLNLKKYIDFNELKNVVLRDVLKHIEPNLILFIPLLGMSVYHVMDKTMLGALSTYEETGFYYNADKVINIPMGIITGIGTVMLPRVTVVVNSGDRKGSEYLFRTTIEIIVILSSAMTFGIASISEKFVPLFFGNGFESCVFLITVLSPVLIIKGLSYISRMQYLIPHSKEKIFIESVFIGAIFNFIINLVLIPKIAALGAVFGTLFAELIACIWQYMRMGKYIKVGNVIFKSLVYIIFGGIMYAFVYNILKNISNNLYAVIVGIIVGFIIYSLLCIIYWKLTKSPLMKFLIDTKQ